MSGDNEWDGFVTEREVLTPDERRHVEDRAAWIASRLAKSVLGLPHQQAELKALRITLARGDGPTSEGGAPVTLPDASQVKTLLSPAPVPEDGPAVEVFARVLREEQCPLSGDGTDEAVILLGRLNEYGFALLRSPAPPTALPELVAAAERIRAAWRQVYPGGCKMLSRGDACECVLCDVDRLLAASRGGAPTKDAQPLADGDYCAICFKRVDMRAAPQAERED